MQGEAPIQILSKTLGPVLTNLQLIMSFNSKIGVSQISHSDLNKFHNLKTSRIAYNHSGRD